MRRRRELVERSFAHILDRGGMRRAWLRGRENVHKRYLIHVAGFNLGLLMRALYGKGTPKEAAEARNAIVLVLRTDTALTFALIARYQPRTCGARYRHRHKHELKTPLRHRTANLTVSRSAVLRMIIRLRLLAGLAVVMKNPLEHLSLLCQSRAFGPQFDRVLAQDPIVTPNTLSQSHLEHRTVRLNREGIPAGMRM